MLKTAKDLKKEPRTLYTNVVFLLLGTQFCVSVVDVGVLPPKHRNQVCAYLFACPTLHYYGEVG